MRYKPWGEVRYSWTSTPVTTPSYALSKYTFTGQYSYMDDPSTSGVSEGFGLMFYNSRMYDSYLNHFTQPDTIVPGGVQGYDRYAYTANNPVNYTDPSGHVYCGLGVYCGDGEVNGGSPLPQSPGNGGGGGSGGGGGGECGNGNINDCPSVPPHYDDGITDEQIVYLNSNNPQYIETDPAMGWWGLPLYLLNLGEWLKINSSSFPYIVGEGLNNIPDASSTMQYYYASEGIQSSATHGVVLNRFYVTNHTNDTLSVNIKTELYNRDVVANSEQGQLSIAPGSSKSLLTDPVGVSTDYTKIVITLNLSSANYNGQIQHVIPTWNR